MARMDDGLSGRPRNRKVSLRSRARSTPLVADPCLLAETSTFLLRSAPPHAH